MLQRMLESAQTEEEKAEFLKILIAMWPALFEVSNAGGFMGITTRDDALGRSVMLAGNGKLSERGYGLGGGQTKGTNHWDPVSFVQSGMYDQYIQIFVNKFSALLETWNPEIAIPPIYTPLEDYHEERSYPNSRRFRRFAHFKQTRNVLP